MKKGIVELAASFPGCRSRVAPAGTAENDFGRKDDRFILGLILQQGK
jgi:hypothetical protein